MTPPTILCVVVSKKKPEVVPLLGPLPSAKPPISQPEIGIPESPRFNTSGILICRNCHVDAESPVQKSRISLHAGVAAAADDEHSSVGAQARNALVRGLQQVHYITIVNLDVGQIGTE